MTGDGQLLIAPERVAQAQAKIARLITELRRVILGKEQTIDEVVAALLARGHVLLEGLPGLGKTELVKALSRLLSLDFRRIQFTPDLLPTDITGSHILQEREGRKEFVFHPGPVFTNVLLADEINRASPKTQAALLEAMQEHRVTTFGETRPLPDPFFVLATQNPIELEGTYPLPEAQLDRFMFKVDIAGVERACSRRSSSRACTASRRALEPVLAASDLHDLFALVDAVHLPRGVANYIARLVAASHPAMRRRAGGGPQLRQVWQLAAGRDRDRRRGARAGAVARQTQRRIRRSPPRGRAGDGASAGARLRGAARRLGRPARRGRAARGDPGDRARTARRRWKRGDCGNGRQTTAPPVAVLRPGPLRGTRVCPCRRRISHGRDRITQDRRSIPSGAVRTAPGYLPVRFDDHQPRRGARHRDSRSGQPISSEV